MLRSPKPVVQKLMALGVAGALLFPDLALAQQAGYTFKAQSELVLVDISVRDKNGNLVRDLKAEDFTVIEDNKPQKVSSFDIENMENTPALANQQVNLLRSTPKKAHATAENPNTAQIGRAHV